VQSREQLMDMLRELQIRTVAMEHQRDAIRKLYDSAAMMNNTPLVDSYRQQMHDLLDLQLDTASGLMQITRSIIYTTK
jgi:hypothetical protein